MQERMEEIRAKSLAKAELDRLAAREQELQRYREAMEAQERDLDAYRSRLKDEQLAREKELQREMEAREKFFSLREKKFIERQREFENHLMLRQAETEHLQKELSNREAKLQQALTELEQEKERYSQESRKKIELTSKDYVSDALEALDKKENEFHSISKNWSRTGAGALITGIGFFAYVSISSWLSLPSEISWELLTFIALKGFIAVALLAGLAKYSFLFSSSYMQEALKNADRRHAINFGKFYLESYGAAADWTQIKEAFEHWNISGTNAFTRTDNSPPNANALEKAIDLIERAGKILPKEKPDQKT